MTTERWIDGKRRDGCAVVLGIDGWIIMPGNEGLPVSACPCCDRSFPTGDAAERAARKVADFIYPLDLPLTEGRHRRLDAYTLAQGGNDAAG